MPILKDKKFTQKDSEEMIKESAIDYIAYYKILESAVFDLLKRSIKDGWTIDQFLSAIDGLFVDEGIEAEFKEQDLIKQLENMNDILRKFIC